jgi:16S rRNA (cytosine1402-N4)-methyltransferase
VSEDFHQEKPPRRPRYSGKNPRRFEEKYKELNPDQHPETVAKVLASGKTPAGSHIPIMVNEVIEVLRPRPGDHFVDCTLGHGGHARKILPLLQPGGLLIGIDADPIEQPLTETRLRGEGYGPEILKVHRANFAGLSRILGHEGLSAVDAVLADLGVSSMQLDRPSRGFSTKNDGPLDMRMNPSKGIPASRLIETIDAERLAQLLSENGDEPWAALLAGRLAGRSLNSTIDLASLIQSALPRLGEEEVQQSIRRVFQALRIAVNEEFAALETLLRQIPLVLKPGGRVCILSFHSGEDRRVKQAFLEGLRSGCYSEIASTPVRASPAEVRANPRASSAKMRWALRKSP